MYACYPLIAKYLKGAAASGLFEARLAYEEFPGENHVFNPAFQDKEFSELYGIPLDAIIGMGTAINPAIHSISGLVLMCVVPLNLLKGGLVSLLTILVYKKLSPILKAAHKQ